MSSITVNNLSFSYDGKTKAVDGLNFKVDEGEIFGFLGPSGAGKSTTIKLLTRLLVPSPDTVFLMGKDVSKIDYRFYKKIGISFEGDVVYPTLTGLENLYYHAKLYGVSKEDIYKIMKTVDIYNAKDKKVSEYSKGMKTRLVLARAMVTDPKLLFLDEPTSGMDPEIASHIRGLLGEMNKRGTTMFLTTHDMHEAEELCDRIAFFNNGKIIETDTPASYKRRYGKNNVIVQANGEERVFNRETEKEDLLTFLEKDDWSSIHSQEASLEEIFIKVVGRGLKGGE
ncbi:ABC transporter ATP-binding protein [Rossellomorea aquimaris]|nr:ABC transporter ATP-binding protein [Rossellomorea aquimaris]WRP07310.1 ABC transporter ATP-binding protein [Rossellomorea aquimaris]